MSLLAESLVDWGALGDVVLISVCAGVVVALTLGVGVVASMRAGDERGSGNAGVAVAFNAVTAVSVVVVAAAVVMGIHYIVSK